MKRTIYNIGKKGSPKYVLTINAVIYAAPAGFKPVDGQKDVEVTPQADGSYTDAAGNVFSPEGHNPGCGPRCPANLRAVQVSAALAFAGLGTAAAAALGAVSPDATLTSVWKSLPDEARKEILKAAAPPAAAPTA